MKNFTALIFQEGLGKIPQLHDFTDEIIEPLCSNIFSWPRF